MRKYVFVLSVAAVIVVLDQLTKWYIDRTMDLHQSIPVIDSIFHITYSRNTGGAFGLFREYPASIRLPFFLTMCMIAVGVLLTFVRSVKPGQWLLLFALGGILGGAIGNFIDRSVAGEVIDFLDVHWRGYYWPTFNVADSFITTGTIILLIHSLFTPDPTAEAQ